MKTEVVALPLDLKCDTISVVAGNLFTCINIDCDGEHHYFVKS